MWNFRNKHACPSLSRVVVALQEQKAIWCGVRVRVRSRAARWVDVVALSRRRQRRSYLARSLPFLHVTAHDHALGKLHEPLESIHLGTDGGRLH